MTEGRAAKATNARRASMAVAAVAAAALVGTSPVPASAASTYKVSASGKVKLTKREPATKKIEQQGPVAGSPFGRGTLTLRSRLAARRVLEYSIRLVTPNGVVTGSGRATLKAGGSQANYSGTLTITGGSGRYKRVSRSNLRVAGVGDSAARTTTVRITGSVRY